MKRKFLMGLLILLVSIGGILAGRGRANSGGRRSTMTAATITSRMTDYAPNGTVNGTWVMTRRQYTDGSWKTHIDNVNGKPFDSSGRINPASLPTREDFAAHAIAMGRGQDQVLGYTVFIQKDPSGTEVWYSPELDTPLKEVIYQHGKLDTVIETVSVTLGEPN